MLDLDLARPYRVPKSRFRKVALVLLLSLALLVAILEVGSRVADGVVARAKSAPGFDPKTYEPGVLDAIALPTLDPAAQKAHDFRTIPHPYLAYALKPSWKSDPEAAQQASHNALGFRGKETTREKPPGVFRIVTLGGSSVYGQSESKDGAVWSARLEEILGVQRPGSRIEVINAGCPGYRPQASEQRSGAGRSPLRLNPYPQPGQTDSFGLGWGPGGASPSRGSRHLE